MLTTSFAELYGVTTNAIHQQRANGVIPSHVFIDRFNIDVKWFERRWAFIDRVKYANQDLFYFLTEEVSASEIAREVSRLHGGHVNSILMYLTRDLFYSNVKESGNIVTRVTPVAWNVFRYYWSIEKRLRRRGTSMSKILDKRMEN